MEEPEVVHTVMPEDYHHRHIHSALQFLQCLAAGPYAWPGGYPVFFVAADGEPLRFESAREMELEIINAYDLAYRDDQWRMIGLDINWEDPELYCSHSEERIESAYAEPEEPEQSDVASL